MTFCVSASNLVQLYQAVAEILSSIGFQTGGCLPGMLTRLEVSRPRPRPETCKTKAKGKATDQRPRPKMRKKNFPVGPTCQS